MYQNLGILGIILITFIGIIWWQYENINYNYRTLPNINSPKQLLQNINAHKSDQKLTYEYYYRPGCKHCEKMAKMGIIKYLRATSKQTNLVAINVTDFNNANPIEAKNWFDATYVSRTPTLIIRDHGYPIYTYAGENFQTLKTLLSGKNPQTNQKFKFTNTPTINIIQNEFEKSNIKIDAYRPNNLTNVKD